MLILLCVPVSLYLIWRCFLFRGCLGTGMKDLCYLLYNGFAEHDGTNC